MKRVPPEAISDLRRRLSSLAPRSTERRLLVEETARLYGVSTDTLYRALRERAVPKPLRRCDHGVPRVMGAKEMERFCEVVAAIKVRTSNKKAICAQPLETDKIAHCALFITLIFRPFQEMADMLGSAASIHVGAL
jgi:hypothetical protein